MRSVILVLPALLISACVPESESSSSHRCRSGIITVDRTTVAELRQRCGPPEHIEPIENRYGAALGERWIYRQDGGKVSVVIRDSRVRRIDLGD